MSVVYKTNIMGTEMVLWTPDMADSTRELHWI